MKTREGTKGAAEEPRWYASAARPPTPGELAEAGPADPAKAGPGRNTDEEVRRRRLRWVVGIYVAVAAVSAALGNVFNSLLWACMALFFAVSLQPPGRASKFLQYFSAAAVVVIAIVWVVLFILKLEGN